MAEMNGQENERPRHERNPMTKRIGNSILTTSAAEEKRDRMVRHTREVGTRLTRRQAFGVGALGTAALAMGACKSNSDASAATSSPAPTGSASRPEMTDLRFGMIALTDCSPIVIAHEKGLFKKYG